MTKQELLDLATAPIFFELPEDWTDEKRSMWQKFEERVIKELTSEHK